METNNPIKSALWNRLDKHDLSERQKDQLIAELDVFSNLVIDSYLDEQYNKAGTNLEGTK